MHSEVVAEIPHDPVIQVSEAMNATVIPGALYTPLADRYSMLEAAIVD